MELLDCVLIGVCVVVSLNTVIICLFSIESKVYISFKFSPFKKSPIFCENVKFILHICCLLILPKSDKLK